MPRFARQDILAKLRAKIARFSSTELRISVTAGLCRYSTRWRSRSGTDSQGPKLTMSSAPHEPT